VSSDQALHVARLDAEAAYGNLDAFRITIAREADGWHIDFDLKDPDRDGGGPHYAVDAESGRIVAQRYAQ
jgi:hypothetical protein